MNTLLRRRKTDHDFSHYKKNTICRRIERRMNVHQIEDIKDYVSYLEESETEVGILFKELLIGVTNFFRDAVVFDALRDKYLPKVLWVFSPPTRRLVGTVHLVSQCYTKYVMSFYKGLHEGF